jgi:hypothetical protein
MIRFTLELPEKRCCNHRILSEIRKNEHGGGQTNVTPPKLDDFMPNVGSPHRMQMR